MLANAAFALQLLVGGVFLFAAAAKLLHLSEFRAAVHGFGVVPTGAIPLVSSAIPLLELLCGTLLITGVNATWGVWLGMGLVALFLIASSVALAQGRGGIDCYCFGPGGQALGKATVMKQVVVLTLLALLAPAAGPIPLLAIGLDGNASNVAGVVMFVIGAWAVAFVAAELLRLRTVSHSR